MSNKFKDIDSNILIEAIKNAPKKDEDPLVKLDLTNSSRLSISYWLRDHDISQGRVKVQSKTLFDHYLAWCEKKELPYIATHFVFGKVLADLLPKRRLHRATFYYINKDLTNVKEEKED